jgi:cytochrome b subunit of formate dehydrogenase
MGWLSAITILALTGLIIWISYAPKNEKINNVNILSTVF